MLDSFINKLEKFDLSQLEIILKEIEKQQIIIINNGWEEHYKEKCGAKYLSLVDIFISMDLSNLQNDSYKKLSELKEFCYKSNKQISISEIIEKSAILGLEISREFSQMICKACICEGCSSCDKGEHCNGYTCKKCKENKYKGYDWCCEE